MIQLEGALSVKAAMLAGKRTVYEIVIDEKKKDKDTAFIIREAKKRKIPICFKTRAEIDAISKGKTHGGILSKVSNRSYQNLEDAYEENAYYCILEGVEDPFNLGYCFRNLYASACKAVILPRRNWEMVEDVIVKSSAGASEYLSIVMSDDLNNEISFLKEKGVLLLSAHRKDAVSIYEADLTRKVCLAIGGEMRGLSKIVLEKSDGHVYIPYGKDVKVALNASSATAVIAFELSRQRRKG